MTFKNYGGKKQDSSISVEGGGGVSKVKTGRGNFKFFLLLGCIARFALLPFTGYEFDVGVLKFASRAYYEQHKVALFSEWTNPPLLYYIMLFSYSFYYLLHYKLGIPDFYPFVHSTGALEAFFLKLPFTVADIFVFIILKRSFSLLELEEKKSLALSSMYFFSPYVIYISSAHGMWDSLAAFFIVFGFYFVIKWQVNDSPRNLYYATLLFVASCGAKWVGLAPLFLLFSILIAKKAYVWFLKTLLVSISSLLLLYLPFFFHGTQYLLKVLFFRTTGGISVPYSSNYFQTLIFLGVPGNLLKQLFLPAYLIFCLIVFVLICYLYRKRKVGGEDFPPNDFELLVAFTLLMINVFYLLYYAVYPHLFVWFMAVAPFFLGMKGVKKEIRERFRVYLLLFSLIAGIFLVAVNGVTVLFGTLRLEPSQTSGGTIGLLTAIATSLLSAYFVYMSYLVGKGFISLFRSREEEIKSGRSEKESGDTL